MTPQDGVCVFICDAKDKRESVLQIVKARVRVYPLVVFSFQRFNQWIIYPEYSPCL